MENKPVKMRIMSDLHTEHGFKPYKFPHDKLAGKGQILVLAGDISSFNRMDSFLEQFHHTRFKKVLFICGNHEFYGKIIEKVRRTLGEKYPLNQKITFLDDSAVEIDGVKFIGSTLWADFDKGNPLTMEEARNTMNDHRFIRMENKGYGKFLPRDSLELHLRSKHFIEKELKDSKEKGKKTVVITHHAPSPLSIDSFFRTDPLNGAYVSDLSNMILDYEPIFWIHGHTHISFDYILGNTRVICNPRGYDPDMLNPNFNKELIVEI